MSDLTVIINEYNVQKRTVQENIKKQLIPIIAEVLNKHNVQKYSFRCYTPYFNDGDACTFRTDFEDYDCENEECINEIEKITSNLPDELMEDVFGNHVEVTVNRDGTFEVSHYDHD